MGLIRASLLRLPPAFQKAGNSGSIFRGLSPPCFAKAEDGQPVSLLTTQN